AEGGGAGRYHHGGDRERRRPREERVRRRVDVDRVGARRQLEGVAAVAGRGGRDQPVARPILSAHAHVGYPVPRVVADVAGGGAGGVDREDALPQRLLRAVGVGRVIVDPVGAAAGHGEGPAVGREAGGGTTGQHARDKGAAAGGEPD